MKFYICEHCKNIVTKVVDKRVPIDCCGEKMKELIPNQNDGAALKHIPVVEVQNNEVVVTVGSINHPTEEKHFIEWIAIKTKSGFQIKYLKPEFESKAVFKIDEELEEVYSYCNLHGLWKD